MNRLAACGVLLCSLGAFACTENSDPEIVSEATEAINDENLPGAIRVASIDGVVTLTGTVPDLAAKERAEDVVEDVDGVDRVVNNLRTTAGDAPLGDAPARDPLMRDGTVPDPHAEPLEDTGSPSHRAGDAPSLHERDTLDRDDSMRGDEPHLGGEEGAPSPR